MRFSIPVRLGRNALNDLQLDESFVSQWHGVIRFDEKQTLYLDLGSTNPTLIDGEPVKRNIEVSVTDHTDFASARCACTSCACRHRASCMARDAAPRSPAPAVPISAAWLRRCTWATSRRRRSTDRDAPLQPLPHPPRRRRRRRHRRNLADVLAANHVRSLTPANVSVAISGPPPAMSSNQPGRIGRRSVRDRAITSSIPPCMGAINNIASLAGDVRAASSNSSNKPQGMERAALFDQLVHDFPEISPSETDLRELSAKLGMSPLRTGVPEMEDWLKRLTDGLFPPADSYCI